METLAKIAEGFIGLFQEGGEQFVGMVGGILPTVIVLITFLNAMIKIIGEDRVQNWAQKSTGNAFTRYVVLPFVGLFFLGNPMSITLGKFLDGKYKPAFCDAIASFVHPITGLFPHANPAELFVYLGIAEGVKKIGLPVGQLAVRYFIVGLIVILIRGMVTEFITKRMLLKRS